MPDPYEIFAAGSPPRRLAYRVEDFAAATGIGRTMVFAAIKSGQLRARKLGAKTLILEEDGRKFLASLPEREAA